MFQASPSPPSSQTQPPNMRSIIFLPVLPVFLRAFLPLRPLNLKSQSHHAALSYTFTWTAKLHKSHLYNDTYHPCSTLALPTLVRYLNNNLNSQLTSLFSASFSLFQFTSYMHARENLKQWPNHVLPSKAFVYNKP